MVYVLFIHIGIAIYICIDGVRRRVNTIPWAIGATIIGPVILPEYIGNWSYGNRPEFVKYFALLWALLLVVSGIWSQKITTCMVKSEPLENKLAFLNRSGSAQKDNIKIDHFRRLLDELSRFF